MPQAQRSIVVNVTPEQFMAVIGDYDKYPEFIADIRKIKVLKREGNVAEVEYEIEVIKKIHYTVRIVTEGLTARWSLVKGDLFKKNEGAWQLKAEGDGKTHATYTLEIAFGGFIPVPGAVVSALTEKNLPALLDSFKKRAEQLHPRPAA